MKMKSTTFLSFLVLPALFADEAKTHVDTAQQLEKHQTGSEETAVKQDSLAGDVQQLRLEQTQEKVATLLAEVETLMDEASGNLLEYNTGGQTLSAQTEVIEKIFEAAKSKKCNGNCKGSQGMMQMMERMMGKNSDGDEKKPGKKPGQKPSDGATGDSATANSANSGLAAGEKAIERRVPKSAGTTSAGFPEEFQKALDGYNRATK